MVFCPFCTEYCYYDDQYRTIQNHVQNHLMGWDIYENDYNFDHSLNKSIRLHYANSASFPLVIKNRFEYDNGGRLVNEFMSVGAGKAPPEKLVGHYEYNLLGQLIKKDLDFKPATSDYLQHIDYRYNIRGWLTSINNTELVNDGTKNMDDLDVFGEEIYYDQTDAITIDQTVDNPFVPLNKYNGNISAIRWKTRASDISADTKPENIYCYRYDDLNRMTAAYYAKSEIGLPGFFNTDYHLFNEKLSYDLDGNIRSLNRQHPSGAMDELTYTYDGHKLMEVTDGITTPLGNGFTDGNTSGDDYAYDSNGNLTEDLNKSLTFQYNHLNLPTIIEDGTDELSYLYDATGRKLRTNYPDSKVHDYVTNIEYEDNELLFINTSFGRIKATGPQEFCSSNFAYEYFINDHLGSVRAVITRDENAPQHNYSATMETSESTAEEAMFYNVDITRANGHAAIQSYTSSFMAALTKSTGEPIGPAKVLQVQEGDKISIDVKYYYDTYTGGNTPRDITDILAQLANFFILSGTVAPPGLESSWASTTFTGNSAVSAIINTEITSSDPVLAYLAYITLDENFNLIADASGILKADIPDVASDLNVLDLIIPKNGYIYIYVANESPTDVYFDNLQIIHKKSNVLELNDYYPYGLRNESLSQTSLSFDPMNSYQYQDKELQTALGLNTHEFGLRHYDATLGRWSVQDPMTQFFNPYLAMGNNPVSYYDPNGGKVFTSYTPSGEEKPTGGGDKNARKSGGCIDGLYLSDSQMQFWMGNDNFMSPENIDYTNSYFGAITQTYYLVRDKNGNSHGLFANKGEAEMARASTTASELNLKANWHGDKDNNPILTNDGNGGAIVHISINAADGTCVWSNWNGEYGGSSTEANMGGFDWQRFTNYMGFKGGAAGTSLSLIENLAKRDIIAQYKGGGDVMEAIKDFKGVGKLGTIATRIGYAGMAVNAIRVGIGFVNGTNQNSDYARLGINAALTFITISNPIGIIGLGAYAVFDYYYGDQFWKSTGINRTKP